MTQNPQAHTSSEDNALPWHKQFWPWFLIGLLSTVVIACIGLVFLAFYKADQLIDENYYDNGLAINEVKHDLEQADTLGIGIQLHLSKVNNKWRFDATYSAKQDNVAEQPKYLLLSLEHPLEQALDQDLLLKPNGDTYTGFFELNKTFDSGDVFKFNGKQFWYIDIRPADSHAKALPIWRLKGKFYSSDTEISLGNL